MHRDTQESDQRVEERVQCGQTAGAALKEGCLRNSSGLLLAWRNAGPKCLVFQDTLESWIYVSYFDLHVAS